MKRSLETEKQVKRQCVERISCAVKRTQSNTDTSKRKKLLSYSDGYNDGLRDANNEIDRIIDVEVSFAINNIVSFYETQIQYEKLNVPNWVM